MPELVKPDIIHTWQMIQPGELQRTTQPVPMLQPGEVLVEVAGCGVCHTDLSYFFDGIATQQLPPLTLGHEISGTVVACAGEGDPLLGKEVIIPSVLPCHRCEICMAGRSNRCLNQKMPGNSLGIYGGYASHIPVPGADLCIVERRGSIPLAHLSVVADAVTTPYHAARRANLCKGDRVIIIGAAGGIGRFMVQIAQILGASTIIGIDINLPGLIALQSHGIDHVIHVHGLDTTQVKRSFKDICVTKNLPANHGWKIFEASGSRAGQEIGLSLLSFMGKLVIMGYGTDEIHFMLSRLMAYDAEMIGIWGCPVTLYPEVLSMCLDGRINLRDFVDTQPMSQIKGIFSAAQRGGLSRRIVLVPDF